MKKIYIIATLLSIVGLQTSICSAQDAVYKLLRYEWTLNDDGTSDYHYRHEVQILRNRALVAYADKGETFVVYNPDLEELTINEVYTIQKDGTRVNMPQNAFISQLPEECADCGRFNHIRELAMVHTGMELGCTIVVDYTIHRQYNLLHESIPLQRECPVEKLEVVVNYNRDNMDLHYAVDGFQYLDANNAKSVETAGTAANSNSLHYTFDNLPEAPHEPYMPADIVPTLRIYNSVPEFTPAFTQEAFRGASDVMGQVMNKKGKENIVAARNFVVDNIHLNDIPPSHLGYRHATAAEVWQTGCGTPVDKAVLLAGILNAEGYSASVAGDGDEVAVYIDTLEYRLSVRSKTPMTLYGKAKDEVKTINIKSTFDATLDTIGDGFYSFPMPFIHLEGDTDPIVRASQLPLSRVTPLQTSACDINTDITYLIPKGVKLVGGKINRELSFDGVGSVKISITLKGNKLRLVRNMKVEKSLIPADKYSQYRQLLATWQEIESLLLRSK
ncbi:MAG: DUF3857 domain-containing protein [Bacteroidales bacterium]|nr:DUF3857 domain-containing protein [Bacteroidales bacterium]